MAVCRMARVLLPLAWVNSSLLSYGWAPYAGVLLPLAWVTSSLASYGCTPYGAIMIAFGLCYHIFAIVWLHVVWRKHCCLWPGLPHFCHCMAVRRMARALLPLAWLNSSLLSYGCTPYGASIIAFGLGYLIFAIVGCTSYSASIIALGLG